MKPLVINMIFQMQESHVECYYLHMCARQGVGLNKGEESNLVKNTRSFFQS